MSLLLASLVLFLRMFFAVPHKPHRTPLARSTPCIPNAQLLKLLWHGDGWCGLVSTGVNNDDDDDDGDGVDKKHRSPSPTPVMTDVILSALAVAAFENGQQFTH